MKRKISKTLSFGTEIKFSRKWKDWAFFTISRYEARFSRVPNTMGEIRKHYKDLRSSINNLRAARFALTKLVFVPPIYLTEDYIKEVLDQIDKEIQDKETLRDFGVRPEINRFSKSKRQGRARIPFDVAIALLVGLNLAAGDKGKLEEIYSFLKKEGELDLWLDKTFKSHAVRRVVGYPRRPKDWAHGYRQTLMRRIASEGRKTTVKRLSEENLAKVEKEKKEGLIRFANFVKRPFSV